MTEKAKKVALACHLRADRAELLRGLIRDGHSKVEATFEGSGDEGWIDWIAVDGAEDEDGAYPLTSFLHEVINSVLPDWADNEGGGGKIAWDLRTDKITISGGYYERVREDSSWAA